MWDPQRLTTLWAFTAWYRDIFTFYFHLRARTLEITLTLLSDFDKSVYCRRTVSFAGPFSLDHYKVYVSPFKRTNEVLRIFCNEISTVRVFPYVLFTSFILRFIVLKAPNFCWGTVLQAGRSRVQFPMRSLDFSIDLTLPSALLLWGRVSI
jgi:hypothetical protein